LTGNNDQSSRSPSGRVAGAKVEDGRACEPACMQMLHFLILQGLSSYMYRPGEMADG